jgi:predicted DNA-binding transcriptional regulator
MKLVGGIALLFVAAFMTLGFALGGANDQSWGVRMFAMLISVGIPGFFGVRLIRSRLSGPALGAGRERVMRQTQESEILKLAQRFGGKLTVVEVVAETAMSAEDADAALGQLVQKGLAEPEVTDKGLIVYVIHDVQQLKNKQQSRGILE